MVSELARFLLAVLIMTAVGFVVSLGTAWATAQFITPPLGQAALLLTIAFVIGAAAGALAGAASVRRWNGWWVGGLYTMYVPCVCYAVLLFGQVTEYRRFAPGPAFYREGMPWFLASCVIGSLMCLGEAWLRHIRDKRKPVVYELTDRDD